MSSTAPSPARLRELLAEQNQSAAALDRVVLEDGPVFMCAERRYAGPVVGDRVLVISVVVRRRAVLDDPDRSERNLARIEALSWSEALSFGQRPEHEGIRVQLDYNELTGNHRLRLDAPVIGIENRHEGPQQIVAMALGEALRETGRLATVACDEDNWELGVEWVVEQAVQRAEAVRRALTGGSETPPPADQRGR